MGDSASSINDGAARGKVMVTENADHLLHADLDVIIEATGVTEAGTYHAWTALEAGKHVIMANVETDVLVGPLLKKKADEKGLVYSMAYGDQPGNHLRDGRLGTHHRSGSRLRGKGTRYQPEYRYSTPDTVWNYFGFTEEQVATGQLQCPDVQLVSGQHQVSHRDVRAVQRRQG